ncbi:uncharacterized protein LOC115343723 [Aquila chrysaetos chrysaetos]|uniref:uncharacterized protein LOC115343723 n=1 Tax=Aquila chrysaetos chrysaetos TaxID=223781 RepID=UPI00117720F1|nr:uncharacterized protein LOC115343723 [Aquila chrysaetos chrysaetos]
MPSPAAAAWRFGDLRSQLRRVLLSLDENLVLLLNPVWMDFQQAPDSRQLGCTACEIGPFGTWCMEQAWGEATASDKVSRVVGRFPKQPTPPLLSWAGKTQVTCFVAPLHRAPSPATLPTFTAQPLQHVQAAPLGSQDPASTMPNRQRLAAPRGNAQGWEEGGRPGVEEAMVAPKMQFDAMPMEILAAAVLASRPRDGHAGQQAELCPVLS